jgi:hypothetical protein
LSVTLTL